MLQIKTNFWRRRRQKIYSNFTVVDRKRKLLELLGLLVVVGFAHVAGMMVLEKLSFVDALWLTLATITTVGYGDLSATTPGGRLVTILLMFFFGIFLLAQIVGEWIDFRLDRRERMRTGMWRWKMNNHIVIINSPEKDGARYLQILVEQVRKSASLTDLPVQILSANFPEGLPNELASLGVVLRQGQPEGRMTLDEVGVESADFIVVLAVDAADFRADSLTLDILDQLKAFNLPGYVIAECVQDENRQRFYAHGADTVLRPVRAYPELLVRAMAEPGTETILENLFQHQGVHTRRYDLDVPLQNWGALAARLLQQGLGTPLGYVDSEKNIITNPDTNSAVSGSAIFVLVNHDNIPDAVDVAQCVAALE
ncbi:MAG: potassium channel family protein [Pseudomonadales bacterium]|nr:potassium channel family protein [Pseudomonadales bacterium]